MMLSTHFSREEMEHEYHDGNGLLVLDRIPEELVPQYITFCKDVLEPIWVHFGKPMHITSGWRSEAHNAAVGGVPGSDHIATPYRIAADFNIPGVLLITVFDWIRLHSGILFDQVILERGGHDGSEADDCIHISWRVHNRRMALEGATQNKAGYIAREVSDPANWEVS